MGAVDLVDEVEEIGAEEAEEVVQVVVEDAVEDVVSLSLNLDSNARTNRFFFLNFQVEVSVVEALHEADVVPLAVAVVVAGAVVVVVVAEVAEVVRRAARRPCWSPTDTLAFSLLKAKNTCLSRKILCLASRCMERSG